MIRRIGFSPSGLADQPVHTDRGDVHGPLFVAASVFWSHNFTNPVRPRHS
jgi:hypothetical protein